MGKKEQVKELEVFNTEDKGSPAGPISLITITCHLKKHLI